MLSDVARRPNRTGFPGWDGTLAELSAACAFVGFMLLGGVSDAAASSLGGAATSVGFVGPLLIILLTKGWQLNPVAGGFSTLAAFIVFAVGAALLLRARGTSGVRSRSVSRGRPVGVRDGSEALSPQPALLPPGLDRHSLLEEFRRFFLALHSAWDDGAADALVRLTTPDMLGELRAANEVGLRCLDRSRFLTLSANILHFEQADAVQIACVEFSGTVEEGAGRPAAPFREIWLLTRSPDGERVDWRLARHQGLL